MGRRRPNGLRCDGGHRKRHRLRRLGRQNACVRIGFEEHRGQRRCHCRRPGRRKPHQWYSLDSVAKVAGAITAAYRKADPNEASYFDQQNAQFLNQALVTYHGLIATIKAKYAGTPVGASESIFSPFSDTLGLNLITSPEFLKAISEGTDPSLADKAAIDQQIATKGVQVYVFNIQNATPDVQAQVDAAKKQNIPRHHGDRDVVVRASDPLTGAANMLSHPFIEHALVAGTAMAAVCGLVGYFTSVARPGLRRGCIGPRRLLGGHGGPGGRARPSGGVVRVDDHRGRRAGRSQPAWRRRRRDRDVFSWILGLGALFLTYYTSHGSGNNGTANVNVLFGSIFGINDRARTFALIGAAALAAVLVAIARPLLFVTNRPGHRPGRWCADPAGEHDLSDRRRDHRRRSHPDRRHLGRARAARRPGRRGDTADQPSLVGILAVRGSGRRRDLGVGVTVAHALPAVLATLTNHEHRRRST
ncbi:metal ABC transporter solute-binding protein, Zn/Mn family [Mycobacterium tilburgii]